MPFVKSLGEVTITTLLGHTIHVPPDTPTYVPPEVMSVTRQFGCVPCNERGELVDPPAPPPPKPAVAVPQLSFSEREHPKLRQQAVIAAVTKIYRDNNPDDFTVANNTPKVRAVEKLVGFPLSGQELAVALEQYQADV